MVQAKSKKPKSQKPHRHGAKKNKKVGDIAEFRAQLDALGLKIIQVTADGNCFFRALADQLEGNEEEHNKYRSMIVQYIVKHREDFEPFIEDDVPFDEYCQSMEKDGTWAGHMELQAASLVTRRNICIHRLNSPRWYINNFNGREANRIHLCYHDGEHYNSVRLEDDPCEGPAMPIAIKEDANISTVSHKPKEAANETKRSAHKYSSDIGSVKLVMSGTGCNDVDKIEQVLRDVGGDVDIAIEFIIADQQASDVTHIEDGSLEDISCHGDSQNENCAQTETGIEETYCEEIVSSNIQAIQGCDSAHEAKKIPRNRECYCGSKKKCKACCASATVKSSAAPLSKSKGTSSKGRKTKKPTRKRETIEEVPVRVSGPLPDLGALCI
ncbi:OVARIAN TUMOR DOMAIN-containing deubiquitinating enzyme 7 isoform X1 [Typha angustifolia]|uniref:OVARIAN TUMOR DOMAIN-containing deubiquitinating enzyme 7 isoform X1 n=1 Tax=Typha angustifolia TaxID=59011 RepID=UPI003C302349